MQNNKTKVALIYDFDETLSTQYMQDFCLIPQFGMTPDEFWAEANQWSRENDADQVTGSMYYFMKKAKEMGDEVSTALDEKIAGTYVFN